jgi:hypothetical protein
MPRLVRCWGTRFVEEFYNRIEELPDLEMLDNARPPLQAAALIIKHGIRHPAMYPALRRGAGVIYRALAELKHDEDVVFAAGQLGVPLALLRFLVAASGFLDLHLVVPAVEPEQPGMQAPALRQAYRFGRARRGDPDRFDQDLIAHDINPASFVAGEDRMLPIQRGAIIARQHRRYLERSREIALSQAQVTTVCFGHTRPDRYACPDRWPRWVAPTGRRRTLLQFWFVDAYAQSSGDALARRHLRRSGQSC